jgi:hypothetical protein
MGKMSPSEERSSTIWQEVVKLPTDRLAAPFMEQEKKEEEKEKLQVFDLHQAPTPLALEQRAIELDALIRKWYEGTDEYRQKRAAVDHFPGNSSVMNEMELLKVAKNLPKGTHPHCHLNSSLYPDFLLERARRLESMYINSTCALISENAKQEAVISFSDQPPQLEGVNLFCEDYVPQTWMKYSDFCEVFPGGTEAAEKWLLQGLALIEEDVYGLYWSVGE